MREYSVVCKYRVESIREIRSCQPPCSWLAVPIAVPVVATVLLAAPRVVVVAAALVVIVRGVGVAGLAVTLLGTVSITMSGIPIPITITIPMALSITISIVPITTITAISSWCSISISISIRIRISIWVRVWLWVCFDSHEDGRPAKEGEQEDNLGLPFHLDYVRVFFSA